MWQINLSAIGNLINLDGPSPAFSFLWSFSYFSDSRASYLLHMGTWGGKAGQEGFHLPPQAETHFHSPPPWRFLPSGWWWAGRGSMASCGVDIRSVCLRHGRVQLHQSVSSSESLILHVPSVSLGTFADLCTSQSCSPCCPPTAAPSSGTPCSLRSGTRQAFVGAPLASPYPLRCTQRK